MYFGEKKTLVVVYKDELLMNQLKKLVETNDDTKEGVIGTTDDTINIVSWTEKVWQQQKQAGNIQGKILFLGDIKGTDKLIPVLDLKFDDCGVKFGWAGNQAVVYIDPKALSSRDNYDKFLQKLNVLSVPEFLKEGISDPAVADSDEETEPLNTDSEESVSSDVQDEGKHKRFSPFKRMQDATVAVAENLGAIGANAAAKREEILRNKSRMKQQMLFYGVTELYYKGLEAFMNS